MDTARYVDKTPLDAFGNRQVHARTLREHRQPMHQFPRRPCHDAAVIRNLKQTIRSPANSLKDSTFNQWLLRAKSGSENRYALNA
jgi:hypothetical protein